MNSIALHRIGAWAMHHRIPVVPRVCETLIFLLFSAVVPSQTTIGRGTVLGYRGLGIVLHPRATIGSRCLIGPQVTIGGRSGHTRVPVLGDGVFVGVGARILGPVTIGDGAVIGANAVVIVDVPDRCLVAGVPANVIRRDVDARDYATMPDGA